MKLHCFLATTAFIAAVAPVSAIAQAGTDPLEPYARQRNLDRDERAKIRVEVTDRARDLNNANSDDGRKAARLALTGSMGLSQATPTFLKYYVEQCVTQLSPLLTGQQVVPALDAIIVLRQLKHLGTCSAAISGLGSTHVGVRFVAAKASQDLLNLMKRPRQCPGLIAALGKAGGREPDARVISEIYVAIGIRAGMGNIDLSNECAVALAKTLDGRLQSTRDEVVESLAYKAAGDCFKAAGARQRTQLWSSVRRVVDGHVDRLFDPQTSPTRRTLLRGAISAAVNALGKIL
ncbi:MAG: hypothetical protein O7F76_12055 [Planctomycetota bacterium]|nr:hypothetical protein [Planctomycetota bacterium]